MAYRRILILGASARAAASSAHRAGFQIVTADLFADADLASIARSCRVRDYPSEFETILASEEYDAWMITGALENHSEMLSNWIQRFGRYRGCPPSSFPALRSSEWRKHLIGLDVASPRETTRQPPRDEEICWLKKSRRSAGGLQIVPLNRSQKVELEEQEYFQQYIEGLPVSAVFNAQSDRVDLLGITRQLQGNGWGGPTDYAYVGSIGPLPEDEFGGDLWLTVARRLTEVYALRGVFGIDGILQGDRLFVIEVNPRFTASVEVLEKAMPELSAAALTLGWDPRRANLTTSETASNTASNIVPGERFHADHGEPTDGHRRGTSESLQSRTAPPHRNYGKAILWADSDITWTSEMTAFFLDEMTEKRLGLTFADVPNPGFIRMGHPVLTIMVTANSTEMVQLELQNALRSVRNQIAKFQQ